MAEQFVPALPVLVTWFVRNGSTRRVDHPTSTCASHDVIGLSAPTGGWRDWRRTVTVPMAMLNAANGVAPRLWSGAAEPPARAAL